MILSTMSSASDSSFSSRNCSASDNQMRYFKPQAQIYYNNKQELKLQRKNIKYSRKYSDYYTTLDENLGSGSFAVVNKCIRKSDGKEFALKKINKAKLSNLEIETLKREIKILKKLRGKHHTIKLNDTFESQNSNGGDLFDLICNSYTNDKKYNFKESRIAKIMYQLAVAVNHCHSKGIVHRDIKPENILFTDKKTLRIKLTDFGLSSTNLYNGTNFMTTKCGSPNFVAPEILTEETYEKSCDFWALGVCLYMMLSGLYPFCDKNIRVLYQKIMNCHFSFSSKRWKNVSQEAIDLVKNLLTKDPKRRFGYDEIISHDFITSHVRNLRNNLTQSLSLTPQSTGLSLTLSNPRINITATSLSTTISTNVSTPIASPISTTVSTSITTTTTIPTVVTTTTTIPTVVTTSNNNSQISKKRNKRKIIQIFTCF